MVAPDAWSAPSSITESFPAGGVDNARRTYGVVSYCGGYYFGLVLGHAFSPYGTDAYLRYAADPTGTWTNVTVPSPPSGYTVVIDSLTEYQHEHRMFFDGTTYAMLIRYTNGSAVKHRIWYATDPTGTWTSHEFDSSDTKNALGFGYADGTWFMCGSVAGTGAFIGTASSPTGTWTFTTASGSTSYSNANSYIRSLAFNGTHWVHVGNNGTVQRIKTAPTVTGTWTTQVTPIVDMQSARAHPNGYVTVCAEAESFGDDLVYYAADPTGTWSTLTTTDHGLDICTDIAFSGTGWAATGRVSTTPTATYLDGTSPAGTYGTATFTPSLGSSGGFAMHTLAIGSHHWVVAGQEGTASSDRTNIVRYFALPASTTASYLRQRQSPLRTPSRLRGVDTRLRQTPTIQ